MSLVDDFKVPCTLIEHRRTRDGEGGWTDSWEDSLKFDAAIVLNSSINALIAESQGVTGVYTVTTSPNATLQFHDAFRRDSDGRVFRVTKVNDSTPKNATFQFNQYQAEDWSLT